MDVKAIIHEVFLELSARMKHRGKPGLPDRPSPARRPDLDAWLDGPRRELSPAEAQDREVRRDNLGDGFEALLSEIAPEQRP